MPIPRLRTDHTALLVIDMQEKLVPLVAGSKRLVNNVSIMLRIASELGVPFLVTEHYPTGLGRTVEPITNVMIDPAARIEKTRFSAAVDVVLDSLSSWRRSTVLICGIETHVCVLQTVLDLQRIGRQCFLLSDAASSSQPDQASPAIRRMEAAGAVTTGILSATYELLGDARHPSRRVCVDLAKSIML